jgi:DNA repair exonuclease SbcCD ATPase subunit
VSASRRWLIPPVRTAVEELRERISYVEDDRPQLFRRIEELEVQMPPIYETHEETARQIQFLQEWAQRSAEKIDELRRFEDQLEKWRTKFIEEIRQGEQQRDRRLVDWEKELKEYAEHIVGWREILRRYEIEHQDHRRAVSKIDVIAQQLEQAQAEVAEQQRLADERLQRELAAWQVENDKRWRLFLKQRDYDWEEQVKVDVKQSERLDEVEATVAAHLAEIPAEFDRLDENDRRILSRVLSLLDYLDVTLQEHVAERKAQRERLEAEFTSVDDVLQSRKAPDKFTRPSGASTTEK